MSISVIGFKQHGKSIVFWSSHKACSMIPRSNVLRSVLENYLETWPSLQTTSLVSLLSTSWTAFAAHVVQSTPFSYRYIFVCMSTFIRTIWKHPIVRKQGAERQAHFVSGVLLLRRRTDQKLFHGQNLPFLYIHQAFQLRIAIPTPLSMFSMSPTKHTSMVFQYHVPLLGIQAAAIISSCSNTHLRISGAILISLNSTILRTPFGCFRVFDRAWKSSSQKKRSVGCPCEVN